MSESLSKEPFASPTLARIARRYAKEAPENGEAKDALERATIALKSRDCLDRMEVAVWDGERQSWLGGEFGLLARPQCIEFADDVNVQPSFDRYLVATGLAMQGLGLGRIEESFGGKKKGLLGAFAKRSNQCWGIDIGSFAVKAVLLEVGKDIETPRVVDSFYFEFVQPTTRAVDNEAVVEVIKPAIEKFIEEKEPGDTRVWVNLPASSVITRFARLPPVKNKQANAMIDSEIDQKIPIHRDDLVTVKWLQGYQGDEQVGRPCTITATRSRTVDERQEMLESMGLQITALQADTLALVNFVATEFKDLWPEPVKKSGKKKKKKDADSEETLEAEEDDEEIEEDATLDDDARMRSIALLDVGASSTNVVLVSGEGHWSWTVELGGETFTGLLARSIKITRSDAEKKKRDVASFENPVEQYEPVEQQFIDFRRRLKLIFDEALKANSRFSVEQTWCVGGGASTFGWLASVMAEKVSDK